MQAVPADRSKLLGNFDGVDPLEFYHVTMVPIQISLMKTELLTRKEVFVQRKRRRSKGVKVLILF